GRRADRNRERLPAADGARARRVSVPGHGDPKPVDILLRLLVVLVGHHFPSFFVLTLPIIPANRTGHAAGRSPEYNPRRRENDGGNNRALAFELNRALALELNRALALDHCRLRIRV